MTEPHKPSSTEEEYFAREEIEKKRKLALQQAEAMAQQERERLKALHYMKCPKCGMELQTITQGKVEVDMCFNCRGVWLDAGEMEQIIQQAGQDQGGQVMGAILNIFKR